MTASGETAQDIKTDYDAIVIGAGIAGLYQLYKLRELGLNVRVFEAGTGVGGTWYWNRYPGARFDSESYSYAYSFSQELLDEWDWAEHFASQPETLRYLNFVADKFDLRRDIQFNSKVTAATYDQAARRWLVETEEGMSAYAPYLLQAAGCLSAPYIPDFDGVKTFRGETWHTTAWMCTSSYEVKMVDILAAVMWAEVSCLRQFGFHSPRAPQRRISFLFKIFWGENFKYIDMLPQVCQTKIMFQKI